MRFRIVAAVIFFVDQATKWIVQQYMYLGQSIPVIQNIFHLTYVQNPGAAFGMLAYRTAFFISITVVVLGVLVYLARTLPPERKVLRMGLALQFGGALGNLVDRVIYGHVIDFFDFRIWPVFNIADMALVTGVALLFWDLFLDKGVEGSKE